MNEFCLSGTVVIVDERKSSNGRRWAVVTVEDGAGTAVPVAMFGRIPTQGYHITVKGTLAGYNGYLSLKITSTTIEGEAPSGRRTLAFSGKIEKPETKLFADDDSLPF